MILFTQITRTGNSISRVANQTGAIERSIGVSAERISMAIVRVVFTFISI